MGYMSGPSRLVYNERSSSFCELLEKDKSVTIHQRNKMQLQAIRKRGVVVGGGIKFDLLQIETNNGKVGNSRKLKTISKFSKAYYYL